MVFTTGINVIHEIVHVDCCSMLGNRGMVPPPKNMAYRMLGVEIFGVTSSQAVLGSQVHNAARSDTAIKLHADCLYVWPRSTALLALREAVRTT